MKGLLGHDHEESFLLLEGIVLIRPWSRWNERGVANRQRQGQTRVPLYVWFRGVTMGYVSAVRSRFPEAKWL
jgi:hypothetical protein